MSSFSTMQVTYHGIFVTNSRYEVSIFFESMVYLEIIDPF